MYRNQSIPEPWALLALFPVNPRFLPYALLILLLLPASGSAQFFYFGRNKVQYTDFDWHVLKTQHFDIYYYPEMQDLAQRGAFLAEESYKVLEQKFGQDVANRIPLIFYSSHLHFQQTNTTPGFVPEGVGGFFEFLKGRVVIPYTGSMWDFRHVIRHELVHVFMHGKINRVLLDHRMTQDRSRLSGSSRDWRSSGPPIGMRRRKWSSAMPW